jgi:hypothetical protein
MSLGLKNDISSVKTNSVDLDNIFFSLNGQKVTSMSEIDRLYDRLPDDVASLLLCQLYHNLPDVPAKVTPLEDVKVKISETIPPGKKDDPVKTAISSYVKFSIDMIEESIKTEKEISEFTINESGEALGIVVGQSTKEEVARMMKKYSSNTFDLNYASQIHFYNDVSLYVFFDDKNVVEELKFVNNYKGMTTKGLMLGDTVEEAIAIYGQPKMRSPKGAVWGKFAVFCEQDIITSIRIHK